MKGSIIVNTFLRPVQSLKQAERLKEEFAKLSVQTDVVSDAYLTCGIKNNEVITKDLGDFVVYLDKNKYLSELLSKTKIRLFNTHSAIRVCDDKGETVIALSGAEVNLPKTLFGALSYSNEDKIKREDAEKIAETLGLPLVVKESYGSMGNGVYLARTTDELHGIMEKLKGKPHIFQEYLSGEVGTDIRIIVIGGKAVAAMKRVNKTDFRSNVAQGGVGEKCDPPAEYILAAEKAAKALNLDYCGVDLLVGQNQEPVICEVNSNAFFTEMEKVSNVNVAKLYAEYVVKTLKNS